MTGGHRPRSRRAASGGEWQVAASEVICLAAMGVGNSITSSGAARTTDEYHRQQPPHKAGPQQGSMCRLGSAAAYGVWEGKMQDDSSNRRKDKGPVY